LELQITLHYEWQHLEEASNLAPSGRRGDCCDGLIHRPGVVNGKCLRSGHNARGMQALRLVESLAPYTLDQLILSVGSLG
jgi:hypothetical protein